MLHFKNYEYLNKQWMKHKPLRQMIYINFYTKHDYPTVVMSFPPKESVPSKNYHFYFF